MEKKIKTTVGNLDDLDREDWDEEDFLFESDDEHQVWLDKNHLYINGLGLEIHSGVSFEKYDDEYEPDFDFYMFFDAVSKEYLYMEQGSSLITCIHNYTGLSWEEIEGRDCEVILTEQDIRAENQILIFK